MKFINSSSYEKLFNMYNCICNYAKTIVCKNLPDDMARIVFEIAQNIIEEPIKAKQKCMHVELLKHKHVEYLSLLTQVFDKYLDNVHQLNGIQSNDTITRYYIMNLTFDIRLCSESRELYDSFDMFEKFLLKNKAKEGYIDAMKYILQNS
jgi:hypothetical protein